MFNLYRLQKNAHKLRDQMNAADYELSTLVKEADVIGTAKTEDDAIHEMANAIREIEFDTIVDYERIYKNLLLVMLANSDIVVIFYFQENEIDWSGQ